MLKPRRFAPVECKHIIRHPSDTDNPELNLFSLSKPNIGLADYANHGSWTKIHNSQQNYKSFD